MYWWVFLKDGKVRLLPEFVQMPDKQKQGNQQQYIKKNRISERSIRFVSKLKINTGSSRGHQPE